MRVKGVFISNSSDDMTYLISILQLMAKIEPLVQISKEMDINGDGKVGLPEAIYFLQKISGFVR